MFPKKLLLFAVSLIFLTAASALAQQASSSTPQADRQTSYAIGFVGNNYLGVFTEDVTRENMGRYNLREPRGVGVTKVSEASPAARAGIKAGDVILRFDGDEVTTVRKLQRLISEAAPEQTVRLTISRNGSEQQISVTVARRTQPSGIGWSAQQTAELRRSIEQSQRAYGSALGYSFGGGRRIGITTTPLTRQLSDYFGVAGGSGLLITSVVEGSPAARAGLKAGDVITAVDGEKIESSNDLSRALNRKAEGDVSISIVRDRNSRTINVTPEKREPTSINIPSDLIKITPVQIEIAMPKIEIALPQFKIKPVTIPPVKIPRIEITPEQLLREPLLVL